MISKTRQCGLRRPKTVKANTEKSKAGKVRKRPSLRRGEGCSPHFEVGSLEEAPSENLSCNPCQVDHRGRLHHLYCKPGETGLLTLMYARSSSRGNNNLTPGPHLEQRCHSLYKSQRYEARPRSTWRLVADRKLRAYKMLVRCGGASLRFDQYRKE